MKKIFILFLFINAAISLCAQVEIEWQRCYGGYNNETVSHIEQTCDLGFIISGTTLSNGGDVSGNHGGYDCWIIKLNSVGDIQWQKCLGGTNEDQANSIKQTSDGGYITVGLTKSIDGNVFGNHNGTYDVWLVKLDSLGNNTGQKCLGGTSVEIGYSIDITFDNGYIIAGYTYSNDGDVSGNNGSGDFWLVKLDSNGTILWQKCLGGSAEERAYYVQQTNDYGIVVTGYTYSNDGDVIGNHGNMDAWVVKLDSSGTVLWEKCLGGTSEEGANYIKQTNDNGYIVTGWTYSNDGDVSGNNGNADFWVVKLDSTGILQWQNCLGGSIQENATSVIQTNDDGYVAIGYGCSNDGDLYGNNGTAELWIVKLDSYGNLKWNKRYGGSAQEEPMCIQSTKDYNFIIASSTNSINGDVIGNHGLYIYDFWVVKLLSTSLSGLIFNDINENGIRDPGEQGIPDHLVRMNPGNHYTFTNNDGYYYFRGDTGITNTVKYVAQQYWVETTNNYYYYVTLDSLSQVVDTLDYAVKSRVNVNDVSIYITGSPTRTSFEAHYWLTYKNWGTITANGTIEFQYDSLLTYSTSTLTPVSHVGNTLIYAYDTLGPGAQRMLRVDFQVPGVQNLGDTLHSYAMITPLVPDTFVTNNYDTLQQVITGSYDPNDKQVMPAGYEQWGFVEHGQRLTYTIRFQNTGTDTAITVVIRDTLDADLDIETFVVEANSHPVTWQLHSGNELHFIFQNIMLPDSNVNEPESHGFIRYSISPKPGLADGTTAINTSYIFFDYNPAIVTNTTLNTFVTNIPVTEPELQKANTGVLAFPNPQSLAGEHLHKSS